MNNLRNIPDNFNVKQYILLHSDLSHLTDDEATEHYDKHGFYEKRQYNIIPDDFNYKEYLELNSDLHETDELTARMHYEKYGFFENRRYSRTNININIKNIPNEIASNKVIIENGLAVNLRRDSVENSCNIGAGIVVLGN